MYWQEESEETSEPSAPEVVDLSYRIACRRLPLDHAYELSAALRAALPWLAEEPEAGIHLIHGAESGNGWQRPEDVADSVIHLSRRTRMVLRLPRRRVADAQGLSGRTLGVAGHTIEVGEAAVRPLLGYPAVFARHVVNRWGEDEEAFVEEVVEAVRSLGIEVRKLLCGRPHAFRTPEAPLFVRSVMIADLDKADALRLQQAGIGAHRMLGCGLFIPHKDIAPVVGPRKD